MTNPYRKSRTDNLPHDPDVERRAHQYEADAKSHDYAARRAKDRRIARFHSAEAARLRGLANRLGVSA